MPNNEDLIRALQGAVAVTPDSAPLHKHLADLLMANGDYVEAAKSYRRALDLAPDDADIKTGLAEAYYRQNKVDVALVILEELLRGPNPSAPALLLAARAYLVTGEQAIAAQSYRRAIAADPALADEDLARQLTGGAPETATAPPPENELVFVTASDEAAPPPSSDVERPQLTFKDVGGMEKLKDEIRMKIIHPLIHPEIYRAYGKTLGGGILMYGPPGCGKTHLARATAGEVNAHFLAIGLHDVLDMYLGQSEHNLHAIFELARANTPCVLFFDEVDALGASRSDMRYSAGRQVINQFLSELDGVNTSNEGVLVLAATNAPWHLDSALRRPGRFDRVIFVPPPDVDARAAILQILLTGKPTDKIDYGRLAKQTEDFSGADLRGAVDMAVENKLREAMRTGVVAPVRTNDLLDVIKTIHPTTKEWFATARNYAIYSNQSGLYDDILGYLKLPGSSSGGLKGLFGGM
ncbi:MAG TPA: AAA family ATPase [Anaerolineae bacterium]|nr:AAA family ATPase [Anaerolineae bacterium]HQI87428.1 AAA family ATPase [Anaerolineae bacterium]